MSVSTFFSDSASVIERSVEVKGHSELRGDFSELYEVDRCMEFINKNGLSRVGLQFPDELLHTATSLAGVLQQRTSAIVFILGDTSYGSCCVDEVAAEHAGADSVIHYGPACLSSTRRLPVLYVFGRGAINIEECCRNFRSLSPDQSKPVLVLSDVLYAHTMDALQARLEEDYKNLAFASLEATEVTPSDVQSQSASPLSGEGEESGLECECKNGTCCSKGQKSGGTGGRPQDTLSSPAGDGSQTERQTEDEARTEGAGLKEDAKGEGREESGTFFGRKLNLKEGTAIKDYDVFYVGAESRTLTNFMMVFNKCAFFTFDPTTGVGRRESLNVNRALMRRYHLIERAKDANVVGVVAGTLGVANYLDIIAHLKVLLKRAGKKSYTFVVGKLNVAKLANFMEIDVYVLVACPENSLIDSKEFYRPVVTPFEMEVACNEAREWTGEYVTDFRQLLPGASAYVEVPISPPDAAERTDVSLITGNLRLLGNRDADDGESSSTSGVGGALLERDQPLTVSNVHKNAGEFLAGRSWQGLEQKLGETPVTMATEGRKGIAAGYTHEQT